MHDDVILLVRRLNPSGFCFLMEIRAFVFEKDSGRSSKMTPSCKGPISLKKIKTDSNKVGFENF